MIGSVNTPGGELYNHPSYTAKTGAPLKNGAPGFGEKFTVSQIVVDELGHVKELNERTITIPDTLASEKENGLMSKEDKKNLTDTTQKVKEYLDGAIPVEKGGTGATTADKARAALGAAGIDLLWENASKTSEFASQTLELGLKSYSMYIVIARETAEAVEGYVNNVSVVAKTGNSANLISFTYVNNLNSITRGVTYVTGGNLKFRDAYEGAAVNNKVMIPVFIYGVKGVNDLQDSD